MTSLENDTKLPGEPQEIIPSPEIWVAKLFDELSKDLSKKDPQKKVFEISYESAKDSKLPTKTIFGGIVIRKDDKDFVMILGERQRSPDEKPILGLQFAIQPITGIILDRKDLLHIAQGVLDKKTTGTSGEFFIDHENRIVLDFRSKLENAEANAIKNLSQKDLLTRKGLDLSIKLIQSILKP